MRGDVAKGFDLFAGRPHIGLCSKNELEAKLTCCSAAGDTRLGQE